MNDKKRQTMPSYDDSKVITFGFAVLFIVFIIFGGWMAFAPLASSAVAVGKVSADLNKKTIQHLEGGKVDAIYVKDGDTVKEGDLLLKLSDVQVKAQLDILKSQYQDKIAMLARLQAQRDNLGDINFPKELIDEKARKDQKNIFEATNKKIAEEKVLTQNKVLQAKNQMTGLKSLIDSKQNRVASNSDEIKEWEELFKQKLVDKQRIRELGRENNLLEGEISNAKSDIERLKEQINEFETQQLLREKEFMNNTLDKYVETKNAVSDLESKIRANEDTLERTNITAPIGGVVVGMSMHTIGGVIAPGKPILDIVSQDSNLYVMARVQVTDIDKVQPGLSADIRFSAFNLKNTHVIEGKVIYVSADSFTDEASKTQYYEAKIEVTPQGIEQLKEYGFVLVSGMPAEVMIKIGERTTLSYFVKPFRDMLSRGFNEE